MKACAFILVLLLAGCTVGSSTTDRPALPRPAVAPDGTFWDAIEVSRRDRAQGFLHIVSPRFLHSAFIPRERISEPVNTAEFDEQRKSVEAALMRGAQRNRVNLEAEKNRLAQGYMAELRRLVEDRFIEVGKPEYQFMYRNDFDQPWGPNRAWVIVNLYPKGTAAETDAPEVLRVNFVQDRHRWLIDSFEPDPRMGSFTWTK